MTLISSNDPTLSQYLFNVTGYNLSSKKTSYVAIILRSNHECSADAIHHFVNVSGITLAIMDP